MIINYYALFCFALPGIGSITYVDDLLMNTLGAAVGYLIWKLLHLIFPKAGSKSLDVSGYEPLVYIFGGILCTVLLYNWRWGLGMDKLLLSFLQIDVVELYSRYIGARIAEFLSPIDHAKQLVAILYMTHQLLNLK